MLAGFSEINITPPIGGNMPGAFTPMPTTEPARGTLCATAAAFTADENSIILISMDVLSSKPYYANAIRSRISVATGVPVQNILVAAIHTHTGPALEYRLWLCPPDQETSDRVADLTVESAISAWKKRSEAALGVGSCIEPRFSFNRDFYMKDGTIKMNPKITEPEKIDRTVLPAIDQSVNVMRVNDANGKVQAFLVNYANHPDCHRKDKRSFSADYPGYLRRALQKTYGEDVCVLFFNGAAGDVNCIDFLNRTHEAYYGEGKNAPEIIGNALAEDICALPLFPTVTTPYIAARSEICAVSYRHRTEADYEWAKVIAKNLEAHSRMEQAFATEYLEPIDETKFTEELEVHTLRLGPWTIVGLPSEIYTEIGLRIKADSPYENTLIFELSNGTHGYIPTAEVVNSTAYEAKVSKYNSCCGEETAEKLIAHVLKQLGKMKKNEQIT